MSRPKNAILKIAPPYDDALIARIAQGFSANLGEAVEFQVEEDPALLCGFIVYAGGTVYDMSGKTQMEGLKEHLLDAMLVSPPAAAEEESL